MKYIEIMPEFNDLLAFTQGLNNGINNKIHEITPLPQNLYKGKGEKTNLFHEITPVCEPNIKENPDFLGLENDVKNQLKRMEEYDKKHDDTKF